MKRSNLSNPYNAIDKRIKREVDQLDFLEGFQNGVYSRTMPIKTISEANVSEHWSRASKRHKNQKEIVHCFLKIDRPIIEPPCTIKITRIAPRALDSHDNLRMSQKWIVDALLEYIHPGKAAGRADDDPNIHIEYAQEKGLPKEYAIRIEITKKP